MIEVIDALRQSIEVVPSQYTNLLQVNVTSKDPRKAARIANAIADAYLDQQLEGRYSATRRATDWLKERLDEHKVKLRRSEERFERLKAEMDLVEKEGATLEERQLVRLNEELVQQSARTADARAKYESVLSQADGGVYNDKQLSEIAQSTLITHLRTQLAQVTRDEDSLNSRFGNGHPAVVKVRAEKQGLSREIDGEIRRIVAVLKNEFDIATNRETSLRETLKAGSPESIESRGRNTCGCRELQREAESDKALYEAMLQRMKQAAAQETWKTADFRVVAEAVPPLSSSKPKTKVLVLAGLGLGFGLGFGLTLLTELLDKTFKRGRDVEAKLAIPHLVDVPLLPARQLSAGGPTRAPEPECLPLRHPAYRLALRRRHAGSALEPAVDEPGGADQDRHVHLRHARRGQVGRGGELCADGGALGLQGAADMQRPAHADRELVRAHERAASRSRRLSERQGGDRGNDRPQRAGTDRPDPGRSLGGQCRLALGLTQDGQAARVGEGQLRPRRDRHRGYRHVPRRAHAGAPHRCHGARRRVAEDQGRHGQGIRRPAAQERRPHRSGRS